MGYLTVNADTQDTRPGAADCGTPDVEDGQGDQGGREVPHERTGRAPVQVRGVARLPVYRFLKFNFPFLFAFSQ